VTTPRRFLSPPAAPSDKGAASAPSFRAAIGLTTVIAACVLSLPWLERYHPAMGILRPTRRTEADLQALVDRLPRAAGPAKVFTRMEWANYLTWSAPGSASVFVEGRVELYPDDTWQRYLTVTESRPGWNAVLDRYGVDCLLLDETYHRELISRVGQSPAWSLRLRAGPAVLFVRREAEMPGEAPAGAARGIAGVDF
jgi:hypothetical protein